MIEPSPRPALATTKMRRLADNRLMGIDNSLWLYRAVPLGPVTEAVSPADSLVPAEPIMAMFEELAAQVPLAGMKRRSLAKNKYRQIHMLLLNVPQRYVPPAGHPIADRLSERYPAVPTDRRVLLFGVRLRDKLTSRGLSGAVDTVSQVLASGQAPLEDFDDDTERMNAAMDRAGLVPVRADDIAFADAWWNYGQNPDTTMLYHPDHLHVFRYPESVKAAKKAGPDHCAEWTRETVPGTHAITFTAVNDQLDLEFLSPINPRAQWMSDLVAAGSFAISVRGTVEPGAVTREELRRQRKRYLDDIRERAEHNKMSRSEQDEALAMLEAVEGLYADSAPPTLAGASVIAAFDGQYRDVDQILGGRDLPVSLSMMDNRQKAAMAETWLCSHFRANPILHDLPAQTIAYSGMPSLNRVGDREGALLGFTESDRQPAYFSPTAASTNDGLPVALCAGATGSGKAERLSTPIPTPTGWTTMGELAEGDWVIGRNGLPCQVTHLWPVNETPNLYRITFSDGQEIIADHEHQWLVSDFKGRHAHKKPKRLAAIATWERAWDTIRALEADAASATGEATLDELFAYVKANFAGIDFDTKAGLLASLDLVEAPFQLAEREVPRAYASTEIRKTDPVKTFDLDDALHVLYHRWTNVDPRNAARWGKQNKNRADAAEAVLAAGVEPGTRATMPDVVRMLVDAGAEFPGSVIGEASKLREYVRSVGLDSLDERREVVVPVTGEDYTTRKQVRVYDLSVALKSLALRYAERYNERPNDETVLVRRTTAEMLAEGIRLGQDHARFAVPVTAALNLPEADLPVAPYVFGAWLGDGGTKTNIIAADPDRKGESVSDQEIMRAQLEAAGYEVADHSPDAPYVIRVKGITKGLRATGALNAKHIPIAYARASVEQRLAVLQGLMDTDGTVDVNGCCELSLSDRGLADDALDLIRGLGIKASISYDQPAGYRDADGVLVECKDRHRIHFTTALPVFRLPRKARRLPDEVRETNQWLYVTDVTPVLPGDADYEAARCITVDSDDHTYLCGDGYVVTSNTMVLLHLADQFAAMKTPVIIVDPKALALTTPVPTPTGWSTIGALAIGDTVLGRDGRTCTVTHKSKIFAAGETTVHRFGLDDGQELLADIEHQWVTYTGTERSRLRSATTDQVASWKSTHLAWATSLIDAADFAGKKETATTRGLLAALRAAGVDRWRSDARGVAKVLRAGGVSATEEGRAFVWPLAKSLEVLAEQLRTDADAPYGRVLTTRQMLDEGVHASGQSRFAFPVPAAVEFDEIDLGGVTPYRLASTGHGEFVLRGSIAQRTDALRGYMDTAGRTTSRGELVWSGCTADADVVVELVRSLGFKARRTVGVDAITCVSFRADVVVFTDDAKAAAQVERGGLEVPHRSRFLYVTDVVAAKAEPTQCIRVDSTDHTYLVGGFVVTHNTGSDHSAIVEAVGGQVASLDELASADGIFDPIRFSAKKEVGVELAASVLLSVNPWGDQVANMEVPLQFALGYGVERGATCIGQALGIAKRDIADQLPAGMIERIEMQVAHSPMFRAIVGVNPTTQGLRVADSITLIKVGDAHLDLPEPGAANPTINQRIALALVRMMVYGSAMALTDRDGVIMLDEAWVFLGAGRSEMERLGRLARSQGVLPMLFTQRVSDAVNAGLSGYISRGLIMHIKDEDEARAACQLFKLDPAGRVGRIMTDALMSSTSDEAVGLNWNSMRALRDPETGEVKRGSVCLYVDIAGRAVPTVVNLSREFLRDATTTPAEARRRRQEREAKKAAAMAQAQAHYAS